MTYLIVYVVNNVNEELYSESDIINRYHYLVMGVSPTILNHSSQHYQYLVPRLTQTQNPCIQLL